MSSTREPEYDMPHPPPTSAPPPPPPPPLPPPRSNEVFSAESMINDILNVLAEDDEGCGLLGQPSLIDKTHSSMSSLTISSHSDSNDNLGVWDDLTYEEVSERGYTCISILRRVSTFKYMCA